MQGGLRGSEWLILLVIIVFIVWVIRIRKAKPRILIEETNLNSRRCLACGYVGTMKTWLSNYSFPQFVSLIGLLFCIIPGLIFIAWGWGKYKCPKCGALAKNTADLRTAAPAIEEKTSSDIDTKECPYCAEVIKAKARVCRFCGKELAPVK